MTTTWTLKEAAARLGADERTVRRWARQGLLPARRLPGGQVRIPVAAVLALDDERRAPVADRLNLRDDHTCFGCGRLNPFGLHLDFVAEGDGVRADFVPGRLREGWSGTLHGGIIATLLDEVLAWALFRQQIWAVTTRLAITYRRPVLVGTPLSAHGRLERDRGRLIEASGEVRDATGLVLAEATATFVRVTAEARARLERIYGIPTP
jgi:excisionase family DNA binding protein/uncharacterized protein (TIGR00369 family)